MIDGAEFKAHTQVSAEAFACYNQWRDLLTHWNNKINLVSLSTISNFWLRHALDSQQLCGYLPDGSLNILDMGSGAGFPGLALAIALKTEARLTGQVTLVESNGKKCNFLRAVIRELALPAKVLQARAENIPPNPYSVITARAFAPLPKLLAYSAPFWTESTLGIFPKGERWQEEVKAAQVDWCFIIDTKPSQTDEAAKILLVSGLEAL